MDPSLSLSKLVRTLGTISGSIWLRTEEAGASLSITMLVVWLCYSCLFGKSCLVHCWNSVFHIEWLFIWHRIFLSKKPRRQHCISLEKQMAKVWKFNQLLDIFQYWDCCLTEKASPSYGRSQLQLDAWDPFASKPGILTHCCMWTLLINDFQYQYTFLPFVPWKKKLLMSYNLSWVGHWGGHKICLQVCGNGSRRF